MGRKRKNFGSEKDKILQCACGKEVRVFADAVEVMCALCLVKSQNIACEASKTENVTSTLESNSENIVETPKRKRGRPRKNKLVPFKKELFMSENTEPTKTETPEVATTEVVKNMEVKNKGDKRGRKATVGAVVLSFIRERKDNVAFDDILNVYSAERERLGKKAEAEIEKRNCYSTLYCLCKNGSVQEVEKKKTYRINS